MYYSKHREPISMKIILTTDGFMVADLSEMAVTRSALRRLKPAIIRTTGFKCHDKLRMCAGLRLAFKDSRKSEITGAGGGGGCVRRPSLI